jgi:hypothetical protein
MNFHLSNLSQRLKVVNLFSLEELEAHYGKTMEINGMTFKLEKVEELSGICAVWMSVSYKVYATPYHEDIEVPVHVVDSNEQEVGTDGYPVEVDDFERYCKCVKVLTEKILRRARM